MEINSFRRIITTFADSPADVDIKRGTFTLQVNDELIQGNLISENGSITVEENGAKLSAVKWILRRLGRLDLLADRLISHIEKENSLIVPSGEVLDANEDNLPDEPTKIPNILEAASGILSREIAGSSTILYLTSHAGEGKTTLINELAIRQANLYRKKEANWLLLPIALGGRPFLRFDEVSIGTLVNKFRFQNLYYQSLVELIRLNAIVPAFDGFEEMFVENAAGDVVSALGNLIQMMNSSGRVVIAARKAYFEYKSMDAQSKLYDTIGSSSVLFSKLAINRWNKDDFLRYCEIRKVVNGKQIYDAAASKLGGDHPVLTRAVLVRQLIDVVMDCPDTESLFESLKGTPEEFMSRFVNTIISREAEQKWIDKIGEPARPLISTAEHHELLSLIALEMWVGSVQTARKDLLETIAGLFCEGKNKNPAITRQVIERISQHALIIPSDQSSQKYSFDHEEFYHYYLGVSLADLLMNGKSGEIRDAFRINGIPESVVRIAAHHVRKSGKDARTVMALLQSLVLSAGPGSPIKENAGAICMELLEGGAWEGVVISDMSFPPQSLCGRKMSHVQFKNCYFNPTSVEGCVLSNINVRDSVFERIEVHGSWTSKNVIFSRDSVVIHSIYIPSVDQWIYDPDDVYEIISQKKLIEMDDSSSESGTLVIKRVTEKIDPLVILAHKAVTIFMRSTEINENVLRQKLGVKAGTFEGELLPLLLKWKILTEVPYRGNGHQKRYRISASFAQINAAYHSCNGNIENFLARASGHEK